VQKWQFGAQGLKWKVKGYGCQYPSKDVLWVLVIGGTFTTILGFSAEYIGSIMLVIYTLFIPFVYKG
jgi:hypothetical protein